MESFSEATKRVYAELQGNIAVTQRGLESKLGLSKTTIRAAMSVLVESGYLKRVGPRFGGHWELIP